MNLWSRQYRDGPDVTHSWRSREVVAMCPPAPSPFPLSFRRVCEIAKSEYYLRVRPSVRPHLTTGLLLDGFSWNLMFLMFCFEKLSINFKCHENLKVITGTLHEDQNTFLIISRSILLRMRNVSDKSCRENRNTHFVFNSTPPRKWCRLWDSAKKNVEPDRPQMTI